MLSSEWAATRSKWAAPTRGEAHAEQGKGEHEVDGEQRGTAREGRLEASVDAALGGPATAVARTSEKVPSPFLPMSRYLRGHEGESKGQGWQRAVSANRDELSAKPTVQRMQPSNPLPRPGLHG